MSLNAKVLLLCGLFLVLGACSDSSSTHVVVVVDNSIEEPGASSGLIIGVVVNDPAESPPSPSPAPRLQGSVQGSSDPASPTPEPDLAYVSLAPDGSALGVAGAEDWTGSPPGELSELTWSFDGTRLFLVGRDHLYSGDGPEPLLVLGGISAADGGPLLDVESEGETTTLQVIAAIARAGPADLEDVFAIYVDASGGVAGFENLTRTPERREIDAAWSSDGTRLALLERSDRDTIALRRVSFGARRDAGSSLPVRAELDPGESVIWEAEVGALRDVSAARTRDLLAVSAWNGRDWDVLCIDGRGRAVNLGRAGVDELAPSWSRDDRRLALEQRCTADACDPLPILIQDLEYPEGSEPCPRVSSVSALRNAGALPAWRP